MSDPINATALALLINRQDRRPLVVWGAKAIGQRIGRSADYVRDTLAKEPGGPVQRRGREYCALEADLIAYFSTAPLNPTRPQPNP